MGADPGADGSCELLSSIGRWHQRQNQRWHIHIIITGRANLRGPLNGSGLRRRRCSAAIVLRFVVDFLLVHVVVNLGWLQVREGVKK